MRPFALLILALFLSPSLRGQETSLAPGIKAKVTGASRIATVHSGFLQGGTPPAEGAELVTLYMARVGKASEGDMQKRLQALLRAITPAAPQGSPIPVVQVHAPGAAVGAH